MNAIFKSAQAFGKKSGIKDPQFPQALDEYIST
jgi:hypothetical protein